MPLSTAVRETGAHRSGADRQAGRPRRHVGQAHFIKTVDDLHKAPAGVSPHLQFGVAFCEASSSRLVYRSGNDEELTGLAAAKRLVIEAGHAFVFTLSEGFPVNVLKPPAVCLICARPPPDRPGQRRKLAPGTGYLSRTNHGDGRCDGTCRVLGVSTRSSST